MIRIGSRVRHKDPVINSQNGLMSVLEIQNEFAVCWYPDYRMQIVGTFKITDLTLSNN